MNVLLTGATGFIGTSILPRLLDEGHTVTALVRDQDKANAVEAAGAAPLVGDAGDAAFVQHAAQEADGVIHLASSQEVDAVLVPAVLAALAGSDKPFVHTGGIWTYGSNDDITEDAPADPPAITAWRTSGEGAVLGAADVRGMVVVPSIVYGHGKGLPNLIVDAPRADGAMPALRLIGDGTQHWATVHVDDLAALYVLALEHGSAGERYIGAGGQNPTVRELGEVAAQAADVAGGVLPEPVEETRSRLGALLADALLLDQQARGIKPRIDLGWEPNGPALLEELLVGSYAPARV